MLFVIANTLLIEGLKMNIFQTSYIRRYKQAVLDKPQELVRQARLSCIFFNEILWMGPICANMIIVVADLLNYRNLYHALNVSASFHSRACPSFVNNVLFFAERNRVLSSKLVENVIS